MKIPGIQLGLRRLNNFNKGIFNSYLKLAGIDLVYFRFHVLISCTLDFIMTGRTSSFNTSDLVKKFKTLNLEWRLNY